MNFHSPTGKFCKQFGSKSGPTKWRARSGSKLFDTDGTPEREMGQFIKFWYLSHNPCVKLFFQTCASQARGLTFGKSF